MSKKSGIERASQTFPNCKLETPETPQHETTQDLRQGLGYCHHEPFGPSKHLK